MSYRRAVVLPLHLAPTIRLLTMFVVLKEVLAGRFVTWAWVG